MRRQPAVHARILRRLPEQPGQSGRSEPHHAQPAGSLLHVHGPTPRRVGLSEGEAQRRGIDVRVAKLPMSAVLRTRTIDESQGFMKVLVGAADDRILGFTMIGPEAGEVMAAVQTAILARLPYMDLRDAILTQPPMAEGLGALFSNVPPRPVPSGAPQGDVQRALMPTVVGLVV